MAILSELKKALTTTGDGAALVPYDLDSVLHEELLRLQPLAQLLNVEQAEGKTHEYNVKTRHPQGWFEGETTPANYQNGATARRNVMLKIQRIWGEVTGFAQKVDEKFINALADEISGAVEGMANVMEYGAVFGTSDEIGFTGDAYQYSGILPRIFAYAPGNVIDAGGDKIALADLDAAVAKVAGYRQVRNDPRMWFMSLRMKQVTDGLQTKVQLPLTQAQLADGNIVMDAYARAAILESDMMAPNEEGDPSPACTAVVAADGSLTAGTYNFLISSVSIYGEKVAGTASANVVAGTTNLSADLTWTADADAKLYFIWRRLSAGAYQLIDVIPAKTYDSAGTVNGSVATYTDAGQTAIAVKPLETGEQQILLANIGPQRGASFVGMVDDMGSQVGTLLSYVELARVKDTYPFMLKSYHALKVKYPNLFSVIRHAKLA
jgi:hypothetical protein